MDSGDHGFVPANYVKEMDHKIISVEVKKPIVVKDVKQVKKTHYVKQITPLDNLTSGNLTI